MKILRQFKWLVASLAVISFSTSAVAVDAKCGAGKCGGDMTSTKEKKKSVETKCGAGKCGGEMNSTKEVKKPIDPKCGVEQCVDDKKIF